MPKPLQRRPSGLRRAGRWLCHGRSAMPFGIREANACRQAKRSFAERPASPSRPFRALAAARRNRGLGYSSDRLLVIGLAVRSPVMSEPEAATGLAVLR